MKRRDFLTGSLAGSAIFAAAAPQALGLGAANREYYELRAYRIKSGTDASLLENYLEKAAIPALNNLGIRPVGVFREIHPKDTEAVFVLLPAGAFALLGSAWLRIAGDAAYQHAAAGYLATENANAAYERIDSWYLLAFAGFPKLQLPVYCKNRQSRLFELRTYESHNEGKAQKKVDMFNNGEIELMRELELGPIFYGQALSGPNLPHLTYMTSGVNEAAHKQHWEAFGKHPQWIQMKNDPQYGDTVSKITKWMLQPAACSQI